ncbi:hypothetical protein, partial [Acidomonas methanolica]|uniref:hypothetical protein n=1 Tax=Acidomonas methanolica TaxID=437 RepID=UPI00222F2190
SDGGTRAHDRARRVGGRRIRRPRPDALKRKEKPLRMAGRASGVVAVLPIDWRPDENLER